MRKLLVTSALPYANGPIHLGHLVEYIQTDIWVRYWRLRGRDAVYFCADDTHGTPIMLKAREEGVAPEQLIERIGREHRRDFEEFQIAFDHYHSTHSEENLQLAAEVYHELCRAGSIVERVIEQAYCERCRMFLPDRYIRGACPRCGTAEQYGDSCEACSATYASRDLVAPRCAQCGATPAWRTSIHLFFRLADYADRLRHWLRGGHVQDEVANKLDEWFLAGLHDWDISRDEPYFGFEIPDRPGKYFYVWLDAPVGYMASTLNWCRRHGADFDSYWRSEEAEVVHFIGKDITYFHALFWPAMLMGAGFRTPTQLCVHGFLTVNGQKMSKSRGTFITAEAYLRQLDPQYLRFYYASKLSARIEDLDLSLDDFYHRVNADLVNKIANIPSRVLAIVHRSCGGRLGPLDAAGRELTARLRARCDEAARLFERREFAAVVRLLLELTGAINIYLQEHKPWQLVKDEPANAATVCAGALNAFKIVAVLIQPILPEFGRKLAAMLNLPELTWSTLDAEIAGAVVRPYERLVERMEHAALEAVLGASSEPADQTAPTEIPVLTLDPVVDMDLRVMRLTETRPVPGADRLSVLRLDSGAGVWQVVAGLDPDAAERHLLGRSLLVLVNLPVRMLRGQESHGMILAAKTEAEPVPIVGEDEQAYARVE